MNYQLILEHVQEAIKSEFGKGKVADYIPALAEISSRKFGMAVCTVDGEQYTVGDAHEPFSIQSIVKLFNLQLVLSRYGDMIWSRVGKEPSGDRFNSLVRLEYESGIPRNPFINAGALVTLDVLMSKNPHIQDWVCAYIRYLSCNNDITCNMRVYQSELGHAYINKAMVNLMKGYGNIENLVDPLIDAYCALCALEMSCVDLANAFLCLAEAGYSSVHKETILHHNEVKRISAVMLTCGMYDSVGNFSYRVGLPAKSGVGGGIVAVVPDKATVCVWSPELDRFGNSYVGTKALEIFSKFSHSSIF